MNPGLTQSDRGPDLSRSNLDPELLWVRVRSKNKRLTRSTQNGFGSGLSPDRHAGPDPVSLLKWNRNPRVSVCVFLRNWKGFSSSSPHGDPRRCMATDAGAQPATITSPSDAPPTMHLRWCNLSDTSTIGKGYSFFFWSATRTIDKSAMSSGCQRCQQGRHCPSTSPAKKTLAKVPSPTTEGFWWKGVFWTLFFFRRVAQLVRSLLHSAGNPTVRQNPLARRHPAAILPPADYPTTLFLSHFLYFKQSTFLCPFFLQKKHFIEEPPD